MLGTTMKTVLTLVKLLLVLTSVSPQLNILEIAMDIYSAGVYGVTETLGKTCGPIDPTQVRLLLYKPNVADPIIIYQGDCSKFGGTQKHIYHGWMSSYNTTPWMPKMKDAFIAKYNCDVIVIDWSVYANNLDFGTSYCYAKKIAHFLADWYAECTISSGTDFSGVHHVGHSFGAQMAGIAGYLYQNMTEKSFSRVSGLDPAGPGFYNTTCNDTAGCSVTSTGPGEALTSGSADFVDAYHTNAWKFGTPMLSGTVDIFMDLCGIIQCECPPLVYSDNVLDILNQELQTAVACSHVQAPWYFLYTIQDTNKYTNAHQCDCCSRYLSGDCNLSATISPIGDGIPTSAEGVYYITVSNTCNSTLSYLQSAAGLTQSQMYMCY